MEAEPETVESRLLRGEFMPTQAQPQTKDSVVDFRELSETSKDSKTRNKRKRANPGALSVTDPNSYAPSPNTSTAAAESLRVHSEPDDAFMAEGNEDERASKVHVQASSSSSNAKPTGIARKSKPWKTHAARPTREAKHVKATKSFEQRKRDKAERKAMREQREQLLLQRKEEKRQAHERKREKERLKDERTARGSNPSVVDPAKVKRMNKKQRKNIAFMPQHRTGGAEE